VKRRLFNMLAAVSLVLCMATSGVWYHSYGQMDEWVLNRPEQHPYIDLFSEVGIFGIVWEVPVMANGHDAKEIDLRYWWLATTFSLLPTVWVLSFVHRRFRSRVPAVCPACGYDLRATPHRCPECGAIPRRPSLSA
jgi:hypothetical protein